ncbi:hypothetical protein B0A48_11771 [Cryoendolithus antarcticus]|uniref:Sm domain-containing protein n=1 Tax=Cryoendolithus antarcticus TaxID=1507870 RepID=A0A1V8SSP9_9PEZI|nr:hypothetical protein B0A48_11771 [Cryoendolithus antarcticus]
MLPLSLLTASQGHPMLVELKNGETLNGHLLKCDTYMNLTLKEVVQTSAEGERFWRLPECYVRGNNIKYLRVPDEIVDIVKEQQNQAQQAAQSQRGYGPLPSTYNIPPYSWGVNQYQGFGSYMPPQFPPYNLPPYNLPPYRIPPYNLPPHDWIQQHYARFGASVTPIPQSPAPPPARSGTLPDGRQYGTAPDGSLYILDTSPISYINESGRRVEVHRDQADAAAARAAYDALGGAERAEHAVLLRNQPRGPGTLVDGQG